jgi:hypothetical protein
MRNVIVGKGEAKSGWRRKRRRRKKRKENSLVYIPVHRFT